MWGITSPNTSWWLIFVRDKVLYARTVTYIMARICKRKSCTSPRSSNITLFYHVIFTRFTMQNVCRVELACRSACWKKKRFIYISFLQEYWNQKKMYEDLITKFLGNLFLFTYIQRFFLSYFSWTSHHVKSLVPVISTGLVTCSTTTTVISNFSFLKKPLL